MLVQRSTQLSLRRLVAAQQAGTFSRTALSNFATPVSIALSRNPAQSRHVKLSAVVGLVGQRQSYARANSVYRHAATQNLPQDDAYQILVKQRLNRPVSPHLSIYRPQITWYGSILNRITGCILSGGFYIFGFSYLVAPLFGFHIESVAMASAFGSLPMLVKVGLKFGVALPFTYHSFNGIRHLVWDMGREMSNKAVQRSGWSVVGISVVSAGVLAYI